MEQQFELALKEFLPHLRHAKQIEIKDDVFFHKCDNANDDDKNKCHFHGRPTTTIERRNTTSWVPQQSHTHQQQIDLIEPNACTVITVNGCVPHAANNAKNKLQRQRRRHASKNHSKINSKSSATHNKACSKAHQNQNTNQIDESTNQSTTNKSSQNTLAKSKHVQLKSSNQPTSNSKPHPAPFTRTTNKQTTGDREDRNTTNTSIHKFRMHNSRAGSNQTTAWYDDTNQTQRILPNKLCSEHGFP